MEATHYLAIFIMLCFSGAAWLSEKVSIGYGKHFSHYLRFSIPPRFGWFLYELPNIIWVIYFLPSLEIGPNVIPYAMFSIHYFNRDFIYPFRISPHSKRIPIEVVASALLYTTCNGYLQTSTRIVSPQYEYSNLDRLRILLGTVIFGYGMFANIQCDNILRGLKKEGQNEYKIPYGSLFELVSSGHYLAEIIEWFGFWIASGDLSGFMFFFGTLSILSARAVQTHIWYQKKFSNYPKHRRAIIPCLL